jgi:Na+-transporting methylmalonyl-CoA/oxaloacetate decarboxylase gamma subunit
VHVYAAVFNLYLIHMSATSGVLGVGVVMHVLLCLMRGVWCRCY